jgi:APA family basic amino acid/polyamine antiporter
MLVMLMGQSRVYTMSNDGLLPAFFSEIHENSHTMENNLSLWVVSLFAGLVPVSDLGHMVSIGTLLVSS